MDYTKQQLRCIINSDYSRGNKNMYPDTRVLGIVAKSLCENRLPTSLGLMKERCNKMEFAGLFLCENHSEYQKRSFGDKL